MAITRETVLAELAKYGTKIQEVNQGERGAILAKGQVDGGFCAGFCLDWVRKVILGGSNTYMPKATKTVEEKAQTERGQTLRAATVQMRNKAFREADSQNFSADLTANNDLCDLINWAVPAYNSNKTL